jgi:membrane protease YdiL (CAAX protease family)
MESTTPGSAPESAPGLAGNADNAAAADPGLPAPGPRPIPYWHTFALIAVLAIFSVANARASHGLHSSKAHVRIYLATMVYEWILTAYVWWGLARAGRSMRELIGGRWRRVEDFLLDIAIAAGTWIGALMVLAVAAIAMGMNQTGNLDEARQQIGFLAPQSSLEVILWIALSATAGFCEEVLFRGYFQMQFTRLLRSRWFALVVVSILFGLGHGYEGAQRMVLIALLGFAFGLMSLLRKSLRPAMMAHTLQDTISGLLLRALR